MRGNRVVKYVWILRYAISDLVKREKSGFLKASSIVLPAFLYLFFLGFHPAVQGKSDFLLAFIAWQHKTLFIS